MTDKNEPMTLERALEIAIHSINGKFGCCTKMFLHEEYEQAAAVLRDGEPEVVKEFRNYGAKCEKCGTVLNGRCGWEPCTACKSWDQKEIYIRKTWTERRVLKPVTVTSEPVFEEVEDEA